MRTHAVAPEAVADIIVYLVGDAATPVSDAYTASTTFVILESIRLDLGVGSQVHP